MSKKLKLIAAGAIAVLGLSSQAFAQTDSCSDQTAYLGQVDRNHQPAWQHQTYEGLMFSADLTDAQAQDALGDQNECLLAVHRAEQDLQ